MYCLSEETRIFVEAIGISKSWRSSILLLISNNENTLYKYKIIQNITIEEEKTTTGKVLFSVAKVSRITTWLENFAAKLKIQMRSYNIILPYPLSSMTFLYLYECCSVQKTIKLYYYSFKVFPWFWLAKSTSIIHHNPLLMTKFERILQLINLCCQKCSFLAGICTINREELGTRLSCFGCENKNGRHFTRFKSKN